MNNTTLTTLVLIGQKSNITPRDSLTVARRVCRLLCEVRKAIDRERRAMRRQAAKLRQFEPFTRRAADDIERQADEHRHSELERALAVLLDVGRVLVLDRQGLAAVLGFEALADLLNINQADRPRARREGWHTFCDLVAIHDLENSAEPRSKAWGEGGPLYQACLLATMDFIRTAPAQALPDPFAPGGPFYGAVAHAVNADGSVTIRRPALVVHDAHGSRVIER